MAYWATCYLAKEVENEQRISCSEVPIKRNLHGTMASLLPYNN
jgi:hypothetical protein